MSFLTDCHRFGIGFYSLSGSFSYISICLAEGLQELGVPIYANVSYSSPQTSNYRFQAHPIEKLQAAVAVVVDLDQLDTVILRDGISCTLPFSRSVLLAMNDGLAAFSLPADIPSFCTHQNRFHQLPGIRIPWGFGCSSQMIRSLSNNLAPARNRTVLANFRPSHHQSVREALDLALVQRLQRTITVDTAVSDEGRWGAVHFSRLASSIACLAYCGYFAQDLRQNPYLARTMPPSPAVYLRRTVILRWDSWRFWESLVAGCAAVHLDFEKYGFLLPEMPVAGVHYLGIDLEDIPATIDMLTKNPDRLQTIGKQGRIWALQHYSPIAVARRFISRLHASV